MTPVFYDFETYWSVTHSLTKMHPAEYVMHPETELQSCAIAVGDDPVFVVFGEDEILYALRHAKIEDKMLVAHNGSGFDHLITAWRLKMKPKAWGCTLSMSRPTLGVHLSTLSLKSVSQFLGLKAKGSLEEVNTKGKKLKDFSPEEIAKMKVYNGDDTVICRDIFKILCPLLPVEEMKQIDMTCRMTVEPRFKVNVPLLENTLQQVKDDKIGALSKLAAVTDFPLDQELSTDEAMKKVLASQPKFAEFLEHLGVPVPMKASPTRKDANGFPLMMPAVAKNDAAMQALLEHEDWRVQVAASTRLGVKSTQLETRLETFIKVATALDGRLPVPLNYCGAFVTWRLSGAMKMNMQNLTRVGEDPQPTDALRYALEAPEDHDVAVVDSSNIEMRVAHTMAGEENTVKMLKEGKDLYAWFAEKIFGYPVNKKQHPVERFVGKVAMLSLQYGSSWFTFKEMVRVQSKGKIKLTDAEAKRIVDLWRATFPKIAGWGGIWAACDEALDAMASGKHLMIDDFKLCITGKNVLYTPKGHWLSYPKLRREKDDRGREGWVYGEGKNKRRIYGAQLFENICQHISRLIVMEQTMELDAIEPVVLSCHDEAVFLPHKSKSAWFKEKALEVFSKSPTWWPELPLAAEADIGPSYGHAK